MHFCRFGVCTIMTNTLDRDWETSIYNETSYHSSTVNCTIQLTLWKVFYSVNTNIHHLKIKWEIFYVVLSTIVQYDHPVMLMGCCLINSFYQDNNSMQIMNIYKTQFMVCLQISSQFKHLYTLYKMQILIIGGNGYIGSYLKNTLKQWFIVHTLGITCGKDTNIVMDMKDLTSDIISKYNTVILLGGNSSTKSCSNAISSLKNNVENFMHILSLIENQKFIYASSSSVYGNTDTNTGTC